MRNKVTILDLRETKKEAVDGLVTQNTAALTSLTGVSCQVLLFFYFLIKKKENRSTGPLSLAYLASALQVKENTLKNTIMRLQKKRYIIRRSGKVGRGGWINFKLADSLYQALHQQEALGILKQTDLAMRKAHPADFLLLSPLPEVWRTIDYSVLIEIGFTELHLRQLYEMQNLDALTVQNSIYHFAFDLKHNNKKTQIRGECLNYFMGILSKRAYNAPSNYIHPDIEAWQDYWRTEQQKQKQKEEWEVRVQALELKSWCEQLSDEEIRNLTLEVPENLTSNISKMLRMRLLKKHFVEEVWPLKAREILQFQSTWKNGYKGR